MVAVAPAVVGAVGAVVEAVGAAAAVGESVNRDSSVIRVIQYYEQLIRSMLRVGFL